jgi:hypothetical protein
MEAPEEGKNRAMGHLHEPNIGEIFVDVIAGITKFI